MTNVKISYAFEILDDGYIQHLYNNKWHREDGPAFEVHPSFKEVNNATQWYFNDMLHRDDGLALIHNDGYKEWRFDGLLHRADGPAVMYSNGDQEWLHYHLRHRLDGPATILSDYCKEWWQYGLRHREDGPAVINYETGIKQYWICGVEYTLDEYLKLVRLDSVCIE